MEQNQVDPWKEGRVLGKTYIYTTFRLRLPPNSHRVGWLELTEKDLGSQKMKLVDIKEAEK